MVVVVVVVVGGAAAAGLNHGAPKRGAPTLAAARPARLAARTLARVRGAIGRLAWARGT